MKASLAVFLALANELDVCLHHVMNASANPRRMKAVEQWSELANDCCSCLSQVKGLISLPILYFSPNLSIFPLVGGEGERNGSWNLKSDEEKISATCFSWSFCYLHGDLKTDITFALWFSESSWQRAWCTTWGVILPHVCYYSCFSATGLRNNISKFPGGGIGYELWHMQI